jgi:hypothetical protein
LNFGERPAGHSLDRLGRATAAKHTTTDHMRRPSSEYKVERED